MGRNKKQHVRVSFNVQLSIVMKVLVKLVFSVIALVLMNWFC